MNVSKSRTSNINFGHIRPEHMYIKMGGYGKDKVWAENVAKLINEIKTNVTEQPSFERFINRIGNAYNRICWDTDSFSYRTNSLSNYFGVTRTENETVLTYISKKNRYSKYQDRFVEFVTKKGEKSQAIIDNNLRNSKTHTTYFSKNFFRKHQLNTITMITGLNKTERKDIGKIMLYIESPEPKSIAPVYKKIQPIYDKIRNNKEKLTDANIDTITENIAQIHWYLSQVSPFMRGSAGVADIVVKTLFESKGIQVSAYKRNLDPNLEAYLFTEKEYPKKFKTFFEIPPKAIKSLDEII